MLKFEKIIITSNLLRPLRGQHDVDLYWFYHLIKPALVECGVSDMEISSCKENSWCPEDIYSGLGLNFDYESFATLYPINKELESNIIEHLSERFSKSFVIGFELSPMLCSILNRLNVTYVNVIIYPVRFLDDLYFGASTNSMDVFNVFLKYQLKKNEIIYQKEYLLSRLCRLPDLNIPYNSVLFVGQVHKDTALINNKKFISYNEQKEQIELLVGKYDQILYKPHPYQIRHSDDEQFLAHLQRIPNVTVINENIYQLLSSKKLAKIYSLTSSVCYEAMFFGVSSEWLYNYPQKLYHESAIYENDSFVPLKNSFLKPFFWSEILGCDNGGSSLNNFQFEDGFIRKSIGMKWGYNS